MNLVRSAVVVLYQPFISYKYNGIKEVHNDISKHTLMWSVDGKLCFTSWGRFFTSRRTSEFALLAG